MDHRFTRNELYQLVWTQPTRTVAGTLGISDVALAKTCRRADIPIPPRGFWAKKEASKPISIPPLPPRFPGASETVGGDSNASNYGVDWRQQILDQPIPPVPVFEESIGSVEKRARSLVGHVTCNREPRMQHGAIAKLIEQDEQRKVEYAKYNSSYYAPRYASGVGRRWILIVDTLFEAFQRLGCKPSMATSQYASAYGEDRRLNVIVGEQSIALKLEPIDTARSREFEKNRLRITLGISHVKSGHAQWEDSRGSLLESQLTDIVVTTLVLAEENHRQRAIRSRDWQIERKAEIEKEVAKIRAEEAQKRRELREKELQERIDHLVSQATQMERANQIRAYVRAVKERSSELAIPDEQLNKWQKWAQVEADRIDPIRNGIVSKAVSQFD
jgi:hypothetical protein